VSRAGRGRLWAVAAIVALTVLFFWEPIFTGRVLLLRDIHSLFHPWTQYTTSELRRGLIPLWNHYSFMGQPYAANPQVQLYYPPQLVFLLLPFAPALTVYIIGHTLLLGLGGYWIMRRFHFLRTAAVMTAIVLMFNGWTLRSHEFLTQFASLCWTPLVLALWWHAVRRHRPRNVIPVGVVVALQTLAGHPQRQAYSVLMMAIVWVFLLVRGATAAAPRGRAQELLRRIAWPALGLLLAAALCAVQVVPTVELSSHIVRSETGVAFSFWPSDLLNFVVPYFFGYPDWQKVCYVGLPSLLCAAFAASLLARRSRSEDADRNGLVLVAFIWLAAGMFLAFGRRNPLLGLIPSAAPYWREMMRWPTASLLMVTSALAVLAGAGVEALVAERRRWPIAAACGFLAALCLFALIDTAVGMGISNAMRHPSQHAQLVQPPNPSIQMSKFPVLPHYVRLWMLSAALAAVVLVRRRIKGWAAMGLLGLLVVDLFVFGFKQDFYSPENVYEETPTVDLSLFRLRPDLYPAVPLRAAPRDRLRWLAQVSRPARMEASKASRAAANSFLYGNRNAEHFRYLRKALIEEIALPYRIFRFHGWGSMDLRGWRALVFLMGSSSATGQMLPAQQQPPLAMCERLFSRLNIGMRAGPEVTIPRSLADTPRPGVNAPHIRPGPLRIEPRPRVFAVSGARIVPDIEAAGRLLMDPSFDLDREIILARGNAHAPDSSFRYAVDEVDYSPNRQRVRLSASGPGYMASADCYYRGWTAYVNGRKTDVLQADVALRAVRIGTGEQRVELVYRSASFMAGAWLTLGGLGVLGLAAGWAIGQRTLAAHRAASATRTSSRCRASG